MRGKHSELNRNPSLVSNNGDKVIKWRKTVKQICPIVILAFQPSDQDWRTTKHQSLVLRVLHAGWHILFMWKTVRDTFWHTVVSQSRGDCSIMWENFMDPGSESATYTLRCQAWDTHFFLLFRSWSQICSWGEKSRLEKKNNKIFERNTFWT